MTISVPPPVKEEEKDAPLREDIRLLGRILGDTVREQEGDETFDFVERIRQASIRFHRDNETGARRELAAIARQPRQRPDARDRARLQLFLASGQHRRGPAPHPPQPRPCGASARRRARARSRHAFQRAREAGRRRRGAARLLRRRAGQPGADRASDRSAAQEHAHARTGDRRAARRARARWPATTPSWRATRSSCAAPCCCSGAPTCCARRGCKVIDEVSNGLSYYDYTFFRELPRLYGAIEDELARQAPATPASASPRSCASARGSAATATAIRSSPPTC